MTDTYHEVNHCITLNIILKYGVHLFIQIEVLHVPDVDILDYKF